MEVDEEDQSSDVEVMEGEVTTIGEKSEQATKKRPSDGECFSYFLDWKREKGGWELPARTTRPDQTRCGCNLLSSLGA